MSANNGEGFSKLTPSPKTRTYIINNDPPFARQVAAHNDYGKDRGYWK